MSSLLHSSLNWIALLTFSVHWRVHWNGQSTGRIFLQLQKMYEYVHLYSKTKPLGPFLKSEESIYRCNVLLFFSGSVSYLCIASFCSRMNRLYLYLIRSYNLWHSWGESRRFSDGDKIAKVVGNFSKFRVIIFDGEKEKKSDWNLWTFAQLKGSHLSHYKRFFNMKKIIRHESKRFKMEHGRF